MPEMDRTPSGRFSLYPLYFPFFSGKSTEACKGKIKGNLRDLLKNVQLVLEVSQKRPPRTLA